MDPEFERMTEDRFDHQNPFKGMTGVTNQYKKFIDNQIHNGCDNQEEQQHYVSLKKKRHKKRKPEKIITQNSSTTKLNSGLVYSDSNSVDLSMTVMRFADLIDFNRIHVIKMTKTFISYNFVTTCKNANKAFQF